MITRKIRIAAMAALSFASAAAFAGPTSEWQTIGAFQQSAPTQVLAKAQFEETQGLATQFDATSSAFSLDNETAAATAQGAEVRAQSVVANTAPVAGTPAALQLTLWNFVLNIRAQQEGDAFESLVTSSANIDYTLNGVPAPVPLPPAAWLFAAGLLGLAAWGRRATPR